MRVRVCVRACVCFILVMNGQASRAVIVCVTKSHVRPLCNVRQHPDSRYDLERLSTPITHIILGGLQSFKSYL